MSFAELLSFFFSAGIFIKKAREGDPNFTYKTYLDRIEEISELLERDAQKHDIASGGYPYSTTVSAVAYAARELAQTDPWLKKVGEQVLHVYWPCTMHFLRNVHEAQLSTFYPVKLFISMFH